MSKRQKKVADALATPPSGEEVKEENKLARFSRGVRAVMPACIQQLFQAVGDELRSVYRRPREALLSVVNLLCVLFTALMLWRVLVVYSNSPSPVVVVLSGSMEPALQRGDILFLVDRGPDLKAGDIIVFKVDGRDIPIVHRVLSLHETSAGEMTMLTKGDNNSVDDRGLYAEKQLWLNRTNVVGTTTTFLPYAGLVTIVLNDYPVVKWCSIAGMLLLAFLGYE
ncbi:signal peptidase [Toxoplasma gondii ME49]|uniref:Signal peptidase complex catalytic subunit SEC11 n=12 Tax=Toxoplasma gondii TaxID=5811 RepID=B9Q1Z7_TOXGV|nr:signal peptidase [Toxoplasma gondii ME49]EPR61317.1 signal peptidase [Toxoplasma gondii GT1]ESS33369.1 signal peptidase [Toxoplasma gondii VEG]KAF4642541.1 signal peptidase [Toxoplasma gondii]KFG28493.1 signal peptidase [Toxoplasma gondii p89]KFG32367.1 signal peptidase [Toxoplasma gondii GAB2-2007-GAL-DOM2]KFG36371.1 signal peptidase [Toxoplasma gondii FOU]KFG57380.1 signal peptidase [Toxoplasma gondii RUB]KFH00173.1 signal peptidase [Toxoplasma gondii VAND]PIM02212.1 signal peptidase |eukprot:XP_002371468.1 signal peptidase [Toxoplasma gondii ME49]